MSHAITGANRSRVAHFRRLWDTLLTHDEDLWRRLQRLFETETEEFGLEIGFFARIDPRAGTESFEVVHGDHEQLQAGQTIPLAETYCRKTIEQPSGTLVVDDALGEGWGGDPAYETYGIETYVGTTVETGGELYGTLCFASRSRRSDPIAEEERNLVEMYGQWATYELDRWDGPEVDDTVVSSADEKIQPERIDVMMDALGDQVRRRVLSTLLASATTRADSLEQTIEAGDGETLLYHVHLPKLHEADYVEWDREAGTVTRGPEFYEVEPLLRLLRDRSAEPPV